ncbi:MAG: CYTH domain-containing protein [Bacteroidales bacterium]|nr:CYTH domain-containing protein [Bacteroidales bacterium]
MAQEIERKFLVCGEYQSFATHKIRITQGYICARPEAVVRIRRYGEQAFITIKRADPTGGINHFEWEKEISVAEATELLLLCEPPFIDKIRYYVPFKNHTFEVDEFFGDNAGLVVAEIELSAENESFEKPSWLGEEVSYDHRYFNAALAKNPFKNWEK